METRRNLVRELSDPKYREEFLHPKTRSKFDTFKIMFRPIFKKEKF